MHGKFLLSGTHPGRQMQYKQAVHVCFSREIHCRCLCCNKKQQGLTLWVYCTSKRQPLLTSYLFQKITFIFVSYVRVLSLTCLQYNMDKGTPVSRRLAQWWYHSALDSSRHGRLGLGGKGTQNWSTLPYSSCVKGLDASTYENAVLISN